MSVTKITQMIEEIADESWCDGYHLGHDEGYDEAWDKARNKGFDEGVEAAMETGELGPDVWVTYDRRDTTSAYKFSTNNRQAPEVLELREQIKAYNKEHKYKKRVMLAPRGPRGAYYKGRWIPNFYQSWLPEKSGNVTHYDVYVYDKHFINKYNTPFPEHIRL